MYFENSTKLDSHTKHKECAFSHWLIVISFHLTGHNVALVMITDIYDMGINWRLNGYDFNKPGKIQTTAVLLVLLISPHGVLPLPHKIVAMNKQSFSDISTTIIYICRIERQIQILC